MGELYRARGASKVYRMGEVEVVPAGALFRRIDDGARVEPLPGAPPE